MNSLPFLTRLIAATIIARQNKMLIAELAYERAEKAYLREQLAEGNTLHFTDAWRRRLARYGAALGWKRLGEIATVAKAGTIRGWHRLMMKGKLGVKRTGVGRPKTDKEIEKIVVWMAEENPTWGQMRIAGMLILLLIPLSPRTIAAILDRHGLKPAPERITDWTWKRFVADHMDKLVATDFFTVDVVGWLGKQTYYVLFTIHLATRQVEIVGVTEHPDEDFMVQTARNTTMADTGWLRRVGCKRLIHDRDTKFCGRWKEVLLDAEIELHKIPPRSPNLNAFAERWVRTVKRECVRRLWFLGYDSLCKILQEYVAHYNTDRPHQGLGNRPLPVAAVAQQPTQKFVTPVKASQIRCVTSCRGVIRHYYRAAA